MAQKYQNSTLKLVNTESANIMPNRTTIVQSKHINKFALVSHT